MAVHANIVTGNWKMVHTTILNLKKKYLISKSLNAATRASFAIAFDKISDL